MQIRIFINTYTYLYTMGFPTCKFGGGRQPPPPKFWGYSIEMESAPSQFPGSAFAQPPQILGFRKPHAIHT